MPAGRGVVVVRPPIDGPSLTMAREPLGGFDEAPALKDAIATVASFEGEPYLLDLEVRVQHLLAAVTILERSLRAVQTECKSTVGVAQAAMEYATKVSWRERPASSVKLTRQERRVALRAARGETDAEIAAALRVSVSTIKSHVKSILRKLGLHSRWELPYIVEIPPGGSLPSMRASSLHE